MNILLTNLFLAYYSGTETVVELLATRLLALGHRPQVLAPRVGTQAHRLRELGIPVTDRTDDVVGTPDVIHAHHLTPTLIAMARFPRVPVVFTCHNAALEVEAPLIHPQIRRYVAVDLTCVEKSLSRGVPNSRLSVILNAVDLDRFQPRSPLPVKPKRALLLTKNKPHIAAVREACVQAGLELDEIGSGVGNVVDDLDARIGQYDIVFATARAALEAAAVGCAVVVCDGRGFAGMLTSRTLPLWRLRNLGIGILTGQPTVAALLEAIASYDAQDAALVSGELRRSAGAVDYAQQYLDVYRKAIESPAPTQSEVERATAAWTEELAVTPIERKWKTIADELKHIVARPI